MSYLVFNKLTALKEQIDVLNIKFNELKLLSYPGDDIENIINSLHRLTNEFNKRLIFYKEEGISNEELQLISDLIRIFYQIVGHISNSDVRNHPREIMIPIRELLSYTSAKHIFMTEPTWDLNYSVSNLLNDNYMSALKTCGIEYEGIRNIIKLSFPKIHQNNILGGAIMAHELGHYFDIHYPLDITEKIIVKFINKIDINKYISNIYSTLGENLKGNPIWINFLKSNLPKIILRRWINEIVADILGVAFYGVSSYLASESLSAFYSNIDINQTQFTQTFSDTHPRDGFRNYVRFSTLSKINHLQNYDEKLVEKILELKRQWELSSTETFNSYNLKIDDARSFVVNSVYLYNLENDLKSNIDWIIEDTINEIKSISPNLIYDINTFKEEVPELVNKIKRAIPPNEIKGKPANTISIINAGWVLYTLYPDEIKGSFPSDEKSDTIDIKNVIDTLLKKATLSSSIHRRWINATCK